MKFKQRRGLPRGKSHKKIVQRNPGRIITRKGKTSEMEKEKSVEKRILLVYGRDEAWRGWVATRPPPPHHAPLVTCQGQRWGDVRLGIRGHLSRSVIAPACQPACYPYTILCVHKSARLCVGWYRLGCVFCTAGVVARQFVNFYTTPSTFSCFMLQR